QKMRDFLGMASDHFDIVVLDSAPVLAVPEARILAADCDAALFAARINQTSLRALRQARRVLATAKEEGARLIGVVANGVDRSKRPGSYGYGYGGYGGYGYGLADADFGVFGATVGGDGAAGEPRVS